MTSRYNLLHVAPAYYPATYWGGPCFTVYALNNALAELGRPRIRLLTTDSAGPSLREHVDRSALADLYPGQEMIMTRRDLGADISIDLLVRLKKLVQWADVVHLTAAYSFPTIPTLLVCRTMKKPVVWSPHGSILEASRFPAAGKLRAKRAWEVVCNSLAASNIVVTHVTSVAEQTITQHRLPNTRAVLVPNGVDIPSTVQPRVWLPDGVMRLMYIGRLAPIKAIDRLIGAVGILRDSKVSLRIYGTGDPQYRTQLERLVRSEGLESTVTFCGEVSGDEKTRSYFNADACIVPSHSENFGMVIAEALAHGVPVIASHGTPWDALDTVGCGAWVENRPETLARAIAALRVRDLAAAGLRGRDWMKREYTWQRIATRMDELYRSIIS